MTSVAADKHETGAARWTRAAILDALARASDRRTVTGVLARDAPTDELAAALDVAADSATKRLLAELLGRRGVRSAVPALVRLLSDADADVRYTAADAIGKVYLHRPVAKPHWRDLAGTALLAALNRATDPGERAMEISALGAIGFESAVPVIASEARHTDDRDVKEAAGWALDRLRSAMPAPATGAYADAIAALATAGALGQGGPRVVALGWKPPIEIASALNDAIKPTLQMQQAIQEALKPSALMQQAIQEALKPSALMQQAIQEALKPTALMQQAIQEALKPNADMRRALGEMLAELTFSAEALVDESSRSGITQGDVLGSLLDVDALADASVRLSSIPATSQDADAVVEVTPDVVASSLEALQLDVTRASTGDSEAKTRLATFLVIYLTVLRGLVTEHRSAAADTAGRARAFFVSVIAWGGIARGLAA